MSRFAFNETLYDSYGQEFAVEEVLFEECTEQQHLLIFSNPIFGRVMALDGIVQTTEKDEFVYHEMLCHVPLFGHGDPRRVLIVGGGDGGALREVARHRGVVHITLVDIDASVVEMSRKYLPNHSQGAFDDPRVAIVIADGARYVAEAEDTFDVIISDATDPFGPGETLFSADFYASCQARLSPGGVFVAQNGVAFMQLEEVCASARRLRALFSDATFFTAAVPTYVGGIMTLAWASDDPARRLVDADTLRARVAAAGFPTRYYNAEVHQAAFALPQYVRDAIGGSR